MMEKIKKNSAAIVALILVLTLIATGSYAWLRLQLDSDNTNILKAGNLDLVLDDETALGIKLENAKPQSYQQGITNTEYNFTLTNNGTTAVDYELSLEDLELESGEVRMNDSKVRFILVKNTEVKQPANSKLVSDATDRIIDKGTIAKSETINYTLQVWIDSKAENEVMGQIFYTRLKIDAIQSSNTTPSTPSATKKYTIVNDANSNGVADIGDEIRVGEEHFYVISNDGTTLNALAKYNLNIGSNKVSGIEGIQNENAGGYLTNNGAVAFSSAGGFTSGLDIDLRNTAGSVKEALYGANGYESYIKQIAPTATVSLITKDELEGLGCSSVDYSCSSAPSWVYSTSYWSGSANDNDNVWGVTSDGDFGDTDFDDDYYFGVRPVITIDA